MWMERMVWNEPENILSGTTNAREGGSAIVNVQPAGNGLCSSELHLGRINNVLSDKLLDDLVEEWILDEIGGFELDLS